MPGSPRESYPYQPDSSISNLSFEISPGRSTPLAHLVSASAIKGTAPERLSVHFPAGKTSDFKIEPCGTGGRRLRSYPIRTGARPRSGSFAEAQRPHFSFVASKKPWAVFTSIQLFT